MGRGDKVSLLQMTDSPGMVCCGETEANGAAVQELDKGLVMAQASVWMTPMADEPEMFGRIAASHALGQLYALGVKPELALNMVAFPGCLGTEVLEGILRGGAEAVCEAEAVLAGGHSISDDVPKYGLSVSGFAGRDTLWSPSGARPGDVLVLTKPVGTGILIAAAKAGQVNAKIWREALAVMVCLNRRAWELARSLPVHGCTMVDGRGLLGAVAAMASGSGVRAVLDTGDIPLLSGVKEAMGKEVLPWAKAPAGNGRLLRVKESVGNSICFFHRNDRRKEWENAVIIHCEESMYRILCTPETSGGLLFSLPEEAAGQLLDCEKGFPVCCHPAVMGRMEKREGEYGIPACL